MKSAGTSAKLYGGSGIQEHTVIAMLSRFGRVSLAFGVLAAAPMLGGCVWVDAKFQQTTTMTAPHVAGSGLRVETRNGSVQLRKAAGTEVSITARLRMTTEERLGETTLVANRDSAGVLVITAEPPGGDWQSGEGCSFEVTVPDAAGVTVKTGNGRIEIGGFSGLADLDTSNGRIVVSGHDGELRASTSNGRIEADGVAGPVRARTSNGSVTIRLTAEAAGPVDIRTSNGSVELGVGQAFRGDLEIDTSNGSIAVPEGQEGWRVRKLGRNGATVTVGEGGPSSSIKTSNGSVRVGGGR